jgi:hypothetical protein
MAVKCFYHYFYPDYDRIVLPTLRACGMPQKKAWIYREAVDQWILDIHTGSRRRIWAYAGTVSDTAASESVCGL